MTTSTLTFFPGGDPPRGPGLPGGLSPEELALGFGIRNLGHAINCRNVDVYDDTKVLADNMNTNYMPPMDSRWFQLPSIFQGGAVEMAGWVATDEIFSDYSKQSLIDLGYVPCRYRERECYMPGTSYGLSVCRDWRSGDVIFSEDVMVFATAEEARRFWAAYIKVFRDFADAFNPAVFDWMRYHFDLGDDRNLHNRFSDLSSSLNGAVVFQTVLEAIGFFNDLLRQADKLATNDDVLEWYDGRNLDDSQYRRDQDQFDNAMEAFHDEKKQRFREREDEENRRWSKFLDARDGDETRPPSGGDNPALTGQSEGGATATSPVVTPASSVPTVEALGEMIQQALEPLLADVGDVERLEGLKTMANCVLNAVDRERASLRRWNPFPVELLPGRVADFVRLVAASHSVDDSFVALPLLATAGAALGNAFRLQLKDDFIIPPVLWCILVARTGCNKSGPLSLVVGPMWQTPPMTGGANSLLSVQQGQYIIDDATSEAVLSRLGECPRGLLLSGEELAGWLKSFDAYRKGAGGDEQKWIRLWDVKPYRVDRKASDERITIHCPAVSIAGTIQPELLSQAVDPEKLASGFFARSLVARPPEQKRRWTNVGVAKDQIDFWRGLINNLRTQPFASLDSNTSTYCPNIVTVSPKAMAIWVRWFEEIANRLLGSGGVERVITAKADVQAARLALVLYGVACVLGECSWGCPMPEHIMAAGVRLAEWFLNETVRVFEATCGNAQDEKRTALLNLVHRLRSPVFPRDLQRANSRAYPTAEVARNALMDLASAGHGVWDGKAFVPQQHDKPPS